MVRYFGIHARRAKKAVHIAMEKLGLLVKYIIKPFSWRKNVKEHTGKDPLKCEKCEKEMLLYKVVYHNKNGDLKEYGGLDMLLKKITAGCKSYYEQEKEKPKETGNEENKTPQYCQVCLC